MWEKYTFSFRNLPWLKMAMLWSAVVGATFVIRELFNKQSASLSLSSTPQDILTLALSVTYEALPFIVLGILVSALVAVFIPANTIPKLLPKNRLLRQLSISLFGFFIPVCECGNVPLARSLIMQGLKPSEAMIFLLSAPVINPITILVTWQAFGNDLRIVLTRIFGTLLIVNLVGFVLSRVLKNDELITPSFEAYCENHRVNKKTRSSAFHRLQDHLLHETNSMVPILLIGGLLAGIIQLLVPREILLNLGSDPVLSVFAMIVLAFIVSICANVDAFFALAFVGTFTPGALVAFLVFGPMIDIKMIGLMRTTFTTRTIIVVSFLVTLGSAIVGLGVNYAL